MFDKNKLKATLSVQSKSHKDEEMIAFISGELSKIKGLVCAQDDYGNIYVKKGEADIYPCVVAHTDTVHDIKQGFMVIEVDGAMFAWDNFKHEQTGVGGDDKVGIYICLQALRDMEVLKVAFFRNEEVGCIGSGKAYMPFFDDVSLVLQADRKGSSDFIDYSNGVDLFDDGFKSGVQGILDEFGYKFCRGIATDVGQLKKNKIEVAVANVSCGYYNAHRDEEYVILKEVENCYNLFISIFNQLGSIKWEHKHVEKVYTSNYHNAGPVYSGQSNFVNRYSTADRGNWGGGYDYAANGYEYDEDRRCWIWVGKKALEEKASKKKGQTEVVVAPEAPELILPGVDAGEKAITEVDYYLAKAKHDQGLILLGFCPECKEYSDFKDDWSHTIMCTSCHESVSVSEVLVGFNYTKTVMDYERQNSIIAKCNPLNHYCHCSMTAVSKQAYDNCCSECMKYCSQFQL